MYGQYHQVACPTCGVMEVERIHRSRLEKLCRREAKFRCLRCRRKFFYKVVEEKSRLAR